MADIDTNAYILRISQANPTQLVVINFELILEFLTAARAAFGTDDYLTYVQKAKDGLEQLIQSLDLSVSISHDFNEIYMYAYKLLCDVSFSTDSEVAFKAISEVEEHIEELLKGWRVAETSDAANEAPPVDGESPKVYTGLTYGKDGKAEEYISEDTGRGYMA